MTTRKPKDPYLFKEIADFDARRGYRRCDPPGAGVIFCGRPRRSADADLWRDGSNDVVTRFSSQGYQFSFKVRDASGKPLQDKQIPDLCEHISELLALWLAEGVDDTPSTLASDLLPWPMGRGVRAKEQSN